MQPASLEQRRDHHPHRNLLDLALLQQHPHPLERLVAVPCVCCPPNRLRRRHVPAAAASLFGLFPAPPLSLSPLFLSAAAARIHVRECVMSWHSPNHHATFGQWNETGHLRGCFVKGVWRCPSQRWSAGECSHAPDRQQQPCRYATRTQTSETCTRSLSRNASVGWARITAVRRRFKHPPIQPVRHTYRKTVWGRSHPTPKVSRNCRAR